MKSKFVFTLCLLVAITAGLQGQSMLWSRKSNSSNGLATYGVAFSADGKKLLSGSECHPANIRMFDVATGNLDWDYNVGHTFMCIQGVKFSSNGSLIASVEELGNILIFNNTGTTPVIVDTIKTGSAYAFSADFAPNNNYLAIGASNSKMNLYSLPGGTLVKSVTAHTGYVITVAYSADGSLLASGGSDNKAKIWTADGTLKFTLTGHSDDVSSVKFSPDNAFLITGGYDGKIRIWKTADGSLVRTINAHSTQIKQLDISPNGTMIVSASSDQSCKIWNFNTGSLISTFGNGNSGIVWTVAWSPEGNKIVTGNSSGDVILWDASGISGVREQFDPFGGAELFPNPATDLVQLKCPAELSISSLAICDATGRTVRRLEPAERQFSVLGLPEGVLFLKMTTVNGEAALLRFLVVNH